MPDHLHFSSAEANRFMVADAGDGDVAFEIDDTEHSLIATLVLSEVSDILGFLQRIISEHNVVPLTHCPMCNSPIPEHEGLSFPEFRALYLDGRLSPTLSAWVRRVIQQMGIPDEMVGPNPGCACDEFMPGESPDEHQARVHGDVIDPPDPVEMPRCPWLYQTRQCELNLGHPGRHTNGPFSWSRDLNPDVVMNGPEIHEVSLDVPIDTLLSAIWYSDGSGVRGVGVPLSSPSSDFTIRGVTLYPDEGFVRIHLYPKDSA